MSRRRQPTKLSLQQSLQQQHQQQQGGEDDGSGDEEAAKPVARHSEEMRQIIDHSSLVAEALESCERTIYELEGSYLEDTAVYGNLARGWDGFIDAKLLAPVRNVRSHAAPPLCHSASPDSPLIRCGAYQHSLSHTLPLRTLFRLPLANPLPRRRASWTRTASFRTRQ